MVILTIEDNKFILSITEASLRVYEDEIHLASNQYKATTMYQLLDPDMVVSTKHTGEGIIWDFLELVPRNERTHVLVLSSDLELMQRVDR